MKTPLMTFLSLAIVALVCFDSQAQIKIKKPSISIKKPSLGGGSSDVAIPSKDPSGLFSNCTDDPSATSHRRNAVENLETLEAEYQKESADYEALTKLLFNNERTLGFVLKLEPKVKAELYYERYTPLKERADKEIAIYEKAQVLEKLFSDEFISPMKYENYNPMTFRTDGYSAKNECYCRVYDHEKSLVEFKASKKQYEELTSQLLGYSHERTQSIFTNMNTCLENGNQYAIWASSENVQKEIVTYSTNEKPLNPEGVIKRCDNYLEGLGRIESDNSLELSAEAKTSMANGKLTISATKTEAERYISSGDFDKYKAKLHAEKIAKEFLPKAVTTNAGLSSGAKKYVAGSEMKTYLTERLGRAPVASTVHANVMTAKPWIKKNEFDIPKYRYHEIWVSFKDTDGKCFKTLVYAEYQYLGGGSYENIPTYSADTPIEMACGNMNK